MSEKTSKRPMELFDGLDRNSDGVFDILDLPQGIDPFRFHEFDVFRRGGEEGVLSFYDEHLIQKSIDNLLFLNKFDQEVIDICDETIEIPQFGTKHSFNISVSVGIVLWDQFSKLNSK